MTNFRPGFRRRLRLLKWLIPLGLVAFVVFYEVVPSRWLDENLGANSHLLAEILIFGTIGPVLAFLTLEMLDRWIGERETAELQAGLLATARQKEQEVRAVTDDTIQVLFATSLLITTFKANKADLPSRTVDQIEITEQSLDEAIRRLRAQVLG